MLSIRFAALGLCIWGLAAVTPIAAQAVGDYAVVWRDDATQHLFLNLRGSQTIGPVAVTVVEPSSQRGLVDIDSSGTITIAWTGSVSNAVFFRQFDANGVALGPQVRVSPVAQAVARLTSLDVSSSGGFVVLWDEVLSTSSNPHYQRFDASGVAAGPMISPSVSGFATDVGLTPNGSVVVLDSEGTHCLRDSSGAQIICHTEYAEADFLSGNLCMLPNGEYFVGYVEFETGVFSVEWHGRLSRYSSQGVSLSHVFFPQYDLNGTSVEMAVGNDDYLVGVYEDGSTNRAKLRDPSGSNIASIPLTAPISSYPRVAVGTGGRAVVSWAELNAIKLQEYGPALSPIGLPVTISTSGDSITVAFRPGSAPPPPPPLLPPTGVTCLATASPCTVEMTWTNSQNYYGVEIMRAAMPIAFLPGTTTTFTDTNVTTGSYEYIVRAYDIGGAWVETAPCLSVVNCGGATQSFVRSDVNGDGSTNLQDVIVALDYLFGGGAVPCVDAVDFDDNDSANLSDMVQLLGYLFSSGPEPAAPFPSCGVDPTAGALDCGGPIPAC